MPSPAWSTSGPDAAAARASADGILRFGDPRLRLRCRDVAPDEDVRPLADRLLGALDAARGVGLAAPQLGDLRRVIAVRDPAAPRSSPLVLVNPVVEATSGPWEWFEEGCLSFPGLYFAVRRPRAVRVAYRRLDGEPRRLADERLVARIVQHEVDHLEGILYVDRLPAWRRWLLAPRLLLVRRGRRKDLA